MFVRKETVSVTTDGSGDATSYSGIINGRILAVQYVKDDFSSCTIAVTCETSGISLWSEAAVNASDIIRPMAVANDEDNNDLTYDGTNEIYVPIIACNERIKINIASGGDTKSGTFYIYYG